MLELCECCGEPAHVYACPRPDHILIEVWQAMSDDERIDVDRQSELS